MIVNEHHPVCEKYLIICPNKCSEDEIEREILLIRLDNCPNQLLECGFSHAGCHEKIDDDDKQIKEKDVQLLKMRNSNNRCKS